MADFARRFPQNPLLTPEQVPPSQAGVKVECLLNPGVFRFQGKTCLLIRTAERPEPQVGQVRISIVDQGKPKIVTWNADDPLLDTHDPREFKYDGEGYLSTLSHLRLFVSDDGVTFTPALEGDLWGSGLLEAFGIEDCRVTTFEDGRYFLTYTAVSSWGYGVGLRETADWRSPSPMTSFIGGNIVRWLNLDPACGTAHASGRAPLPFSRTGAGWKFTTGPMKIRAIAWVLFCWT
jgi:predicted GH43/DUF377 family glycosyl hydrolase